MRFGKEKDYEKEDQLFKILEWGNGCLFYDYQFLPESAPNFVMDQFKRFNIPMNPMVPALSLIGPGLALNLVDYRDPYLMFWEWSDVEYTDEWHKFTFDILDGRGNVEEADPCKLEVFKWHPGRAEATFEEWLSKPGVESLPGGLKPYSDDMMEEYYSGDGTPSGTYYVDGFPEFWEVDAGLKKACTNPTTGEINYKWVNAYNDLAMWAGLLWMFGPLSRQFRIEHSEIFEVCFLHGECVLYDGVVLSPHFYRKVPRRPETCYRCGIDAWCTEATLDGEGVLRSICEGCMSKGMPRIEGCTCGTRFCKHFGCKHNAWYQQGQGAMNNAMRQYGQLAQKSKKAQELIAAQTKILING